MQASELDADGSADLDGVQKPLSPSLSDRSPIWVQLGTIGASVMGTGADPGFGFRDTKSSAEGAIIEAPQAPRVYGVMYGRSVPLRCQGATVPPKTVVFRLSVAERKLQK